MAIKTFTARLTYEHKELIKLSVEAQLVRNSDSLDPEDDNDWVIDTIEMYDGEMQDRTSDAKYIGFIVKEKDGLVFKSVYTDVIEQIMEQTEGV